MAEVIGDGLKTMPDDIEIEMNDKFPKECLESVTDSVLTASDLAKILRYGMDMWPKEAPRYACTDGFIKHIMHWRSEGRVCWVIIQRLCILKTGKWVHKNFVVAVGLVKIVVRDGKTFAVFPKTTFAWVGEQTPEVANKGQFPFTIKYFYGMNTEVFAIAKLLKHLASSLEINAEDKAVPIEGQFNLANFKQVHEAFFINFFKAKFPHGPQSYFGQGALQTRVGSLRFTIPFGTHLNKDGMLKSLLKESGYSIIAEIGELADSPTNAAERNKKCEQVLDDMEVFLPGVQGKSKSKPKTTKSKKRKAMSASGSSSSDSDPSDDEYSPAFEISTVYTRTEGSDKERPPSYTEIVSLHAEAMPDKPAPPSADRKEFKALKFDQESMLWYINQMEESQKTFFVDAVPHVFMQLYLNYAGFMTTDISGFPCVVAWDLEPRSQKEMKLMGATMDEQATSLGAKAPLFASICAYNQKDVLRNALDVVVKDPRNKYVVFKHLNKMLQIVNKDEQAELYNDNPEAFFCNLLHRFVGNLIHGAFMHITDLDTRQKWEHPHPFPQMKTIQNFVGMVGDVVDRSGNDDLFQMLDQFGHRLTTRALPLMHKGRQYLVGAQFGKSSLDADGIPVVFESLFPYMRVFEDDSSQMKEDNFKQISMAEHFRRNQIYNFVESHLDETDQIGIPLKFMIKSLKQEIAHTITTAFVMRCAIVVDLPKDVNEFIQDKETALDVNKLKKIETEATVKNEFSRFFTGLGKLESVRANISSRDYIANAIVFCALFATYAKNATGDQLICKRIAPLVKDGRNFTPNPRFLHLSGGAAELEEGVDFINVPPSDGAA